jgi:hypothetical protein
MAKKIKTPPPKDTAQVVQSLAVLMSAAADELQALVAHDQTLKERELWLAHLSVIQDNCRNLKRLFMPVDDDLKGYDC